MTLPADSTCRLLLDELVRTAAARGASLELGLTVSGQVVARISNCVSTGATPNRALEQLAEALGTPGALRAVHATQEEQAHV